MSFRKLALAATLLAASCDKVDASLSPKSAPDRRALSTSLQLEPARLFFRRSMVQMLYPAHAEREALHQKLRELYARRASLRKLIQQHQADTDQSEAKDSVHNMDAMMLEETEREIYVLIRRLLHLQRDPFSPEDSAPVPPNFETEND